MTYYHWLGIEAEEYIPTERFDGRVNFDFGDYLEGLPDDELIAPERGYTPLPEERPSDYGPLEIDISGLEDE